MGSMHNQLYLLMLKVSCVRLATTVANQNPIYHQVPSNNNRSETKGPLISINLKFLRAFLLFFHCSVDIIPQRRGNSKEEITILIVVLTMVYPK